jgi:ParB family chromosome partitioning protein
MTARRNALGRGLGALLGGADPTPDRVSDGSATVASLEIPLDRIDPNPDQPRRRFVAAELARLAESIRAHGVIQPVVVREKPGDRYELVVGERRWRAAGAAGLAAIPAVVADVAPRDRLEVALIENVQRHDLNPIEIALAFRTLLDSGATQEEVGQRVGLDRSSVANHVRLLELSPELQQDVESGRLTAGHAKALLGLEAGEPRRALRDRIVAEGLSVRSAEDLARARPPAAAPPRAPRAERSLDPDLARLVERLRDRLKTRLRVSGGPGRGKLEIDYYGEADLGRILATLLEGR